MGRVLGAGLLAGLTVAAGALASVPVGAAPTGATAPAVPTTTVDPGESTLVALLGDPGLPGFTPAPPGPTNGPLTAATFAAQSSDPAQAQAEFAGLAARPGFGAGIRLWSATSQAGQVQNDVAVLLFRIEDPAAAVAFAAGLVSPYQVPGAATAFEVPSIPGAEGYTVSVTSPAAATEQVVVFTQAPYVVVVQAASSAATSNTAPLTATQVIEVAYLQAAAIRQAAPVTTLPTPVPSGAPTTVPAAARSIPAAPRTSRAAPGATGASSAPTGWPGATLVVLLCGLAVTVLARRRRRVPAVADPFGPGSPFDAFGTLPGGAPAPARAGPAARPVPELPVPVPARPVPELQTQPDRVPPPPGSLRPHRSGVS